MIIWVVAADGTVLAHEVVDMASVLDTQVGGGLEKLAEEMARKSAERERVTEDGAANASRGAAQVHESERVNVPNLLLRDGMPALIDDGAVQPHTEHDAALQLAVLLQVARQSTASSPK